MIHIQLNTGK